MFRFYGKIFLIGILGAAMVTGAHIMYYNVGRLYAALFIFFSVWFITYTSSIWVRFIYRSHRYSGDKRDLLEKLFVQHRINVSEVYIDNQDCFGAYALGLAGLRTITFTKKTIENCAWEGLRVVALHEIAHLRRSDLTGYTFLISVALFFIAAIFPDTDLTTVFIGSLALTLLLLPLLAALKRTRENAADVYARAYTPDPSVAVALFDEFEYDQNQHNPMLTHPPLAARLFFTHPPLVKRQKMFETAQAS